MDGGNHPRGGEPSFSQLLQGLQKGLEILLSLAGGPVAPVTAAGGHHSLRKRREPPIVLPEVKPPALPPLVRRYEDGRDVLLRPRLPQLEDAATGPHRHANSSLPRRRGKKLRGEEMGPQVPVGAIPKNPSQTAAKMAACAMELGLRLCSSTP
jgi:antitoxin (DNA-binding transcriptional repressor) of toxin-antitoxin stability system